MNAVSERWHVTKRASEGKLLEVAIQEHSAHQTREYVNMNVSLVPVIAHTKPLHHQVQLVLTIQLAWLNTHHNACHLAVYSNPTSWRLQWSNNIMRSKQGAILNHRIILHVFGIERQSNVSASISGHEQAAFAAAHLLCHNNIEQHIPADCSDRKFDLWIK